MTIIRTPKNRNYTSISRSSLQDERLSWKARGLLAYLLSLPDDWSINRADLIKRAPDGKSSLDCGLKELEDFGYLIRWQERNELGAFAEWNVQVVEDPIDLSPQTGFPETENPHPHSENPDSENPLPGNRTLLNIQEQNRHYTKRNPYIPLKDKIRKSDKVAVNSDELYEKFEEFWDVYPKKVAKGAAFKGYKKALAKTTHDELIFAAGNYREDVKHTDSKFVKLAGGWLEDERWLDKPIKKKSIAQQILESRKEKGAWI